MDFIDEKSLPFAVRLDTGVPSEQTINTSIRQGDKWLDVNKQLISLPLYLVE